MEVYWYNCLVFFQAHLFSISQVCLRPSLQTWVISSPVWLLIVATDTIAKGSRQPQCMFHKAMQQKSFVGNITQNNQIGYGYRLTNLKLQVVSRAVSNQ